VSINEPRSYPVIEQARSRYLKTSFSRNKVGMALQGCLVFKGLKTGPLEGINNKNKTMKRQAYGFRDQEFFKLKIMGLHMTR
jgi:hypothetical protein